MKQVGKVLIFIIVIGIVMISYTQLSAEKPMLEMNRPADSLRISIEIAKSKRFGLIIDVRSLKERATLGFYPSSIPISIQALRTQLPLDISNKQTPILVYSNGDSRAAEAASIIYQMGYRNVSYIDKPYLALMPGSRWGLGSN
jgi:rhodanese-related sulfurtransferase